MAEQTVTGAGGVQLAVFTDGDPTAPPVLLVHGYPDTHLVWDAVVAELSRSHYVVRYDVRGAGASQAPRGLRPYKLDALADDVFAVIEAVSPQRPVHLVGHDWGSIQCWQAATDSRAVGWISGFTSISGPCLDHVGYRMRRRDRSMAGQATASWYIWAFHVPVVATVVWWVLARQGHKLRGSGSTAQDMAPTLRADARRGVRLYRANMLPRLLRPRRRHAAVPVQVITLTRDRFVRPALTEGLDVWVRDLRRDMIDAGHWSALVGSAPALTTLITDFAGGAKMSRSWT
jgi:pimeloyl-ACP methyl ester carboxylesterase